MSGVFIADPRVLPPPWEPWRPAFAILHILVAVMLIAVAVAWGRHQGRRGLLVSGFLSLLAVVLAYVITIRPSDIPIDWITILHEGLGHMTIRQLYGQAVHAGPSFAFAVSAVTPAGASAVLYDVVWLNVLLAAINAVLFFHIALRVTTPVWAVVWTLVFAVNPAMFLASFSELPTNLLALYFLAGVVAWVTLTDPLPQPRIIRAIAFVACALLTLLAGLTRVEVAAIGMLALALYLAPFSPGADVWRAVGRPILDLGQRALIVLSEHPVLVVVLGVLGMHLSYEGLPWALVGRSASAGLYPFTSSIYTLFIFLPMMMLPIGVAIATLLGFIYAVTHFRRFGGLALSLFVLARTYFAAQNQYFEAERYLSYILPAIFLVALFGREELDRLTRGWHPNWRRATQIGFLLAWFGRPLPGIPEFYARPEYHRAGGFAQVFLDLNAQREVRHLIRLTQTNPECVFVARVIENYARPDVPREYAYGIFGASVPAAIFVSEKEASLDEVIARYAPDVSCVRLYYGGDCNLTDSDGCKNFIAGRRLVDEERFWSRPYNSLRDFGYAAGEVVLATYAWR